MISRLLGVSPGMENYYNLRYDNSITNSSNVGIAIKWNSATKTGELIIINWVGPKFAKGADSYEEYIKLYKGDYSSDKLVSAPIIKATARKEINEEMLNTIVSGAKNTDEGNSISYIMGLDDKLPVKDNTETKDDNKDNSKDDSKKNAYVKNGGSSKSSQSSQSSQSSKSSSSQSGISAPSNGVSSSVGQSSSEIASDDSPSESSDDSSASPSDSPSKGKSYEVSKAPATKSADNNSMFIAIAAAVLILGGILGFGYLRRK